MHVAGVVDIEHKEMRLYRDGRRIATRSIAGDKLITSGNGALRLGYAAGMVDAGQFYGLIDDVRIWSCARSDGQIATAYRSVAQSDSPCLVVDWDFMREREGSDRAAAVNAASRYPEITATLYDGATLFPRGRP